MRVATEADHFRFSFGDCPLDLAYITNCSFLVTASIQVDQSATGTVQTGFSYSKLR